MTPRKEAELEAKRTYEAFIAWTKRVCVWIVFGLVVVVVGCNSGVDCTGSGYNGEQYDPKING